MKQSITNAFLESIEARVPTICHRALCFRKSAPMEPEVSLVSAKQESSGLKPKVCPPVQSHRWLGASNRGDADARIDDNVEVPSKPSKLSSSSLAPAPPLPIYATPEVTSKPFIPCFKASVPARQHATAASRGLCPPAPLPMKVKPVFGARVKISKPVLSSGSASSLPSASSSSSSLPKVGPNFVAATRPAANESFYPSFGPKPKQPGQDAPLGSLDRVLPPIPAEMMKPLFSMPVPIFPPKKEKAAKRKPTETTTDASSSQGTTLTAAAKRPKSAVKADVDIPSLASKPNGLSSVNAATLLDWCRKNGVPCRAKDKKDELVSKVLAKLSFPVAPNEP